MRGEDEPEIIARKVGVIWISSSSTQDVCHDSGESRISSVRVKRDFAGQSNGKVPNFKSANPHSIEGFGDHGRLGKRKRSLTAFKPSVNCNIGNDEEYMDQNVVEIERINESEFRNKRTHSMLRPSTWKESVEVNSTATSRKHLPGDDDMDMYPQDIEVERISKAEFMKKKYVRIPARQESNEVYPEDTGKKTTKWMKNKIFHVGLSGSILPENAGSDSKRWLQDKSTSVVKIGNGHEDLVPHGFEIVEIDEAEFQTEKPHAISKIGLSNREKINGDYVSTPWKNIDGVRKNISSSALCGSFSRMDTDRDSDKGKHSKWRLRVQKGNDNEDMEPEKDEIEIIDETEFRNKKADSLPKIAPSTSQKQNERYSGEKIKYVNERISNFRSGSLSSEDVSVSVDSNGDPDKTSSFLKEGNGDADVDSEKVEIEKMDEIEVRNEKTDYVPMGAPITRQKPHKRYCAVAFSKKVQYVCKKKSNFHFRSLSAEDVTADSNGDPHKSSLVVKKGNDNKDVDPEKDEIEIIDKTEFRNKKAESAPKIAPSTSQRQNERYSGEKIKYVNERISNFRSGSLCCEDISVSVSVDSNGDPDKTSSFMKEGNGDAYVDSEKVEIEKMDETEFRNEKTDYVPTGAPITRLKPLKRYCAVAFRKKVQYVCKKKSNFHFRSLSAENVSADSNGDPHKSKLVEKKAMANEAEEIEFETRGKNCINMEDNDQEWDKKFHDDVNSYYHEWNNSDSSIQSNKKLNLSGHDAGSPEVAKMCSSSSEHDNKLGMANRTRSKTRMVKKSPHHKYSPSCYILESMDDEDFRKDNPSLSDSWEPQYHDIQEIELVTDCSKKERAIVRRSSKKWHLANPCREKAKCDHFSFQEHECSFRKKQLSIYASSKINEEGTYKPNEVPGENYDKNTNLCDDSDEEEVFKNNSDGIKGKLPKCVNLERFYTQKFGDETGANGCKDHSKDEDNGPIDFQVQNGCSQAISGFHVHGKNENLSVADETEHQRKMDQVSSKQYDSWKLLADSVLESRIVPVDGKNDDRVDDQNRLSLKFRFEDELPNALDKTEYGKDIEELFAELDFSRALVQIGSVNIPEVHSVDTDAHDDETQHARCARGNHELFLQDDMGLRCMYCPHVELGPRDVMPMWVEKKSRLPRRTRSSEKGQLPEFNQLNLRSSAHDFTDLYDDGNGTVWNIKPGIKENMYKHQQEGFEFLWKNLAGSINLAELRSSSDPSGGGGCIISHAPGTGKTRLTIVFIETYLKLFPSCRPVIIAPASMLLTWEEEFKKWNVEFPFYNLNNLEFSCKENNNALRLLSGPSSQNKELIRMVKIYSWHRGRSILGMSYSLYEKLVGEKYNEGKTKKKNNGVTVDSKCEAVRTMLLGKPELVVLDEGHTPRNERSNIWNALLKLHTKRRVILSGTPFQNNFAELFNTLRLVKPAFADILSREKIFAAEMMTSRKKSRRKHGGRNGQSTSISKAINSAVERLKVAMSPFVHVHKGTILQQSLPGLRDCVVLLKPPALQKSLIDRIEGLRTTFEFQHKVALISVHPYLLQFCSSVENQWLGIDMGAIEASKLNPNEGVKTKFIFELIRLSLAMNEKVLIFSQYIQPLELIKDQLKETFMWVDGKQIFQMHGKLDQKQRQLMINIFNDPQSEAKVMLASTKCCSEGISLVGASRLVLLDVVWNPSVEQQAISRAYRIGQKKYVYTYHLMTSGTTEGEKYCRQAEKERLSELVFTSSSNEDEKHKHPASGIEDRILEEMVASANLNAMFQKIIYQPKETDLSQTFVSHLE